MLQNLIKLASFLVLGLLISCSSGDGDEPSRLIVVTADDADNGSSTANANTDTGSVTGSDTGTQSGGAGNDTSSAGDTNTPTTGTDSTSGNTTDTGANNTDAGTDATAGTVTDGTATAGTDTTTGVDTTGTTDDIGTTTDGTATDGATTAGDTDGGNDTAGTADDGDTAGTADGGTTAGTDTGGTGTTTAGNNYPSGSLAGRIESEGNLSSALAALQQANLDLSIDDPMNEWTLFLPTDEAIAALASPSDFDLQRHIAIGAVSSATLAALNGRVLNMNNGDAFIVDGSTQDLTIAGAAVIKTDIGGDFSESVLHVIDTVIVEDTGSPYPAGSLADVLFNDGDMTNVLDALEANGLDLALNDSFNQWTLFLPVDSALDDPADFDVQVHIYTLAAVDSESLTGIVGLPLFMNSGNFFDVGGGGTEPLTIGNVTIVEEDVRGEDNAGPIVHKIDGVLLPE